MTQLFTDLCHQGVELKMGVHESLAWGPFQGVLGLRFGVVQKLLLRGLASRVYIRCPPSMSGDICIYNRSSLNDSVTLNSCLVLVETVVALEYVTLLVTSSLWCIRYGWRSWKI